MADEGDDWVAPGPAAPEPAVPNPAVPSPEAEPPRYGVRVPAADVPPFAHPQSGTGSQGAAPPFAPPRPLPQSSQFGPGAYSPPPKTGLIPLHPLSFGRLLGASFGVIRWNPRATIIPAVVVSLLQAGLLILGVGTIGVSGFDRITAATDADRGAIIAGTAAEGIAGYLVILAVGVVASALLQGAIVFVVARGALGEKPRIGAVLRRAARSIWPLIGYAVLVGAAAFVAFLIIGGVAAVLIAFAGIAGLVIGILVAVVGLIGLVVLFVWIGVKLAVVPSAIVLEHLGVRAAIARSWRLTRGSFWRTLGLLVLVQLIVSVAAQIVSVPFTILNTLVGGTILPNGSDDPSSVAGFTQLLLASVVNTIPSSIVTAIVSGIGAIAASAVVALVYLDVRMRREGLDIELRAVVEARAGAAAPADEPDPFRTPGT